MICLPCTRAIFVDMLPPFEPQMNTDKH